MSNCVSLTLIEDSVLLQLVHGPVRDVLADILEPAMAAPYAISEKLFNIRNRVLWLYETPFQGAYTIPQCYNVVRPLVLWCWALEEHRNEADVCIKLLEHIDCLNNPERAFYRDIAIDLLRADSKEKLEKVHRRLTAVTNDSYCAGPADFKPDWSKGRKK